MLLGVGDSGTRVYMEPEEQASTWGGWAGAPALGAEGDAPLLGGGKALVMIIL